MKKQLKRVVLFFGAGLMVQAGIYLYLDQVLFSTTAEYNVSDVQKPAAAGDRDAYKNVKLHGTAHYSYDNAYMADVAEDAVTIYRADDLDHPQKVDLKQQGVSFFEWMPDRNLALIALYPLHWKGGQWDVTLARYNPEGTVHESDAPIEDLPRHSRIVDVAYSTATNAVYMKMEVSDGLYRIYRTDANYDTRRIYVQTSHIGKIAVFYDEDRFFYDDAEDGIMYTFNGDSSSWRIISPPGRFRLVDVGRDKTIYAARVNSRGEAVEYYTGKLGVGFEKVGEPAVPVDFNTVTVHTIQEAAQHSQAEKQEEKKK